MIEKKIIPVPCAGYKKSATLYVEPGRPLRAAVLYYHGGALIYGEREDLPQYHIDRLCGDGCAVLAMDYPLSPNVSAGQILDDVRVGIEWYIAERTRLLSRALPFFLLGRSAGAYLCLMTLTGELSEAPAGILSYYGYGLLCGGWYDTPSRFYLRYPAVPPACLGLAGGEACAERELGRFFALYVYLRQTGKWGEFLRGGSRAPNPSLRELPPARVCPILLAHSRLGPDVPFEEFTALTRLFPDSVQYTVSLPKHDFDSDTGSEEARALIELSLKFINENAGA